MAGFKCPFCGEFMSVTKDTLTTWRFNFLRTENKGSSNPYLNVDIFTCPNDDCQEVTILAEGVNGYIKNSFVPIYPRCRCVHFPEYVPSTIRNDYEEACIIANDSPKAAATLARRCLQGMIHDFWGIHEKNLNAEITRLKDNVPSSQWKAIDAIRSIGNIGAHMEHDVNLVVEVDPGEARKLIRLVEHLIEKWYMDRHDSEELYADVTNMAQQKSDARKR